jgi:hypothetical protein
VNREIRTLKMSSLKIEVESIPDLAGKVALITGMVALV